MANISKEERERRKALTQTTEQVTTPASEQVEETTALPGNEEVRQDLPEPRQLSKLPDESPAQATEEITPPVIEEPATVALTRVRYGTEWQWLAEGEPPRCPIVGDTPERLEWLAKQAK